MPATTPAIDASVRVLMLNTGMSQEEATAAFEVVKSAGFTNIGDMASADPEGKSKVFVTSLNCDYGSCLANNFITI
ncbi:MAG TPA: hypothetical protein VF338_04450, partial [Leptolinea sp.]